MGRVPLVISSRSLGTSTVQTTLSGDRSGNATNFVCPQWGKAIPRLRTFITELTPTAGQSVVSTLTQVSTDTGALPAVGNYEVFATPLGSALSTTATFLNGNGSNYATYPWNFRINPSMQITFYGQAQVANTVAPRQGACLWVDDSGTDSALGGQWHFLTTSKNNNSSNPTSTGTSAGSVTGQTVTISSLGQITLYALYGILTSGTIVASDTTIGWYYVYAPEIPVGQLQWNIEPNTGFLGTVGQEQNLISKMENIAVSVKTPTTITTYINMDVAPANAGNFEVCLGYQ